MLKRYFSFILSVFFCLSIQAQKGPEFLEPKQNDWVDSVFAQLTVEEKVGQLLMPRGNVSGRPHDVEKLMRYVKDYHIGGIVFFAGPPTVQARLTNQLQNISRVPLLIGEDFEWGLAMRMDSTDRFPYNMSLGAINGKYELIEQMGAEVGRQCKRLGVHVNYAPVVDVNININNPVINFRSYGEDKNLVAQKGLAYMKGLQSQNIIATAKHFPGHGDTDVDSHKDLPIIPHSKERLKNIEFVPFQKLIDNGLAGVMTSHLDVPVYEAKPGLAATFSKSILTDLLKNEMGFTGLTFTDAMDMQGAVKNFPKGEALVEALLAGNDVLETFEDVPSAFEAVLKSVKSGKISMKMLDEKVKKILKAKYWVGLSDFKPIEIENLIRDLNTPKSDFLNHQFAEGMITLIKNEDNVIPIKNLTSKIAVISIDAIGETAFQSMCKNYTTVDVFSLPPNDSISLVKWMDSLKNYDFIITALHLKEVRASAKYSLNKYNLQSLKMLSTLKNNLLCVLGNVYSIPKIDQLENFKAIAVGYQNTSYTENALAQAIFGGITFQGSLPVTLNEKYKLGDGLISDDLNRITYGIPEQVGMDGAILTAKIDSLVNLGLAEKAFPGAVVQVIKDGRTVYQKAYGFHTYEQALANAPIAQIKYEAGIKTDAMDQFTPAVTKKIEGSNQAEIAGLVKVDDVYDFASVTKISTSALALLQLTSEGKFDINKTFSTYVPSLANSNKADLVFKDMLTHRSGLKAWIPFWRNAVDTITTVNKALLVNPELDTAFIYLVKKPSFFKRLFGKKTTRTIQIIESVDSIKGLWEQCLLPNTITWKPNIFSPKATPIFSIEINENLWMNQNYLHQIFNEIKESPVNKQQGYVYSDLHYYYYPQMIKSITGSDFDTYLKQTYKKIGANSLTFNPKKQHDLEKIVPTEYDSLFRGQLIHGFVHDEGAAMLDGVSGHAGLFGNANDLSKLMLLYLQKGSYGGERFFKSEIMDEFTAYQFKEENNRRGIAFDKASFDPKVENAPRLSSPESYGHSGYTGTFTWIDPKANLLYVFFANRVYPTRNNSKISDLNIRTRIGDAIYQSMKE